MSVVIGELVLLPWAPLRPVYSIRAEDPPNLPMRSD